MCTKNRLGLREKRRTGSKLGIMMKIFSWGTRGWESGGEEKRGQKNFHIYIYMKYIYKNHNLSNNTIRET